MPLPIRVKRQAMTLQKRAERHLQRMAGISERGVDHVETMDGPEIRETYARAANKNPAEKTLKSARNMNGMETAPDIIAHHAPIGRTNSLSHSSMAANLIPLTVL